MGDNMVHNMGDNISGKGLILPVSLSVRVH